MALRSWPADFVYWGQVFETIVSQLPSEESRLQSQSNNRWYHNWCSMIISSFKTWYTLWGRNLNSTQLNWMNVNELQTIMYLANWNSTILFQTQYVYLHDALAEGLNLSSAKIIPVFKYEETYRNLLDFDPVQKKTNLELMYEVSSDVISDQFRIYYIKEPLSTFKNRSWQGTQTFFSHYTFPVMKKVQMRCILDWPIRNDPILCCFVSHTIDPWRYKTSSLVCRCGTSIQHQFAKFGVSHQKVRTDVMVNIFAFKCGLRKW